MMKKSPCVVTLHFYTSSHLQMQTRQNRSRSNNSCLNKFRLKIKMTKALIKASNLLQNLQFNDQTKVVRVASLPSLVNRKNQSSSRCSRSRMVMVMRVARKAPSSLGASMRQISKRSKSATYCRVASLRLRSQWSRFLGQNHSYMRSPEFF